MPSHYGGKMSMGKGSKAPKKKKKMSMKDKMAKLRSMKRKK